jgi:hypothetical protein
MEGFDGTGQSAAGPVDAVQRTPSGPVGSDTAGALFNTRGSCSAALSECRTIHPEWL